MIVDAKHAKRMLRKGSKWLFEHSRFPERGRQSREVVRYEGTTCVMLGTREIGRDPEEIALPLVPDAEYRDDGGTLTIRLRGVVLTYAANE